MSLKVLLSAVAAFSVGTVVFDSAVKSQVYNYHDETPAPPSTSIIIPTLNEESYLEECLQSLCANNILVKYPEKCEVVIVDSGSRDRTVRIARQYTSTIITAPKGKLTARHIGTMKAKNNIIVGIDADSLYPSNYLNIILKHFQDPHVVGVTSPRLYGRDSGFLIDAAKLYASVFEQAMGRMPGSNSNYRKAAYFQAGGFNLSVDQSDAQAMVKEEEYDFPRRLRQFGLVKWEWMAPCFTSARRITKNHISSFNRTLDYGLLYPTAGG